MILTIDIGNTTIGFSGMKRCGASDYESVFNIKTRTIKDESKQHYAKIMNKELGTYVNEIEGAIISSVVPSLTEKLQKGVEDLTGRPVLVLDSSLDLGLTSGVDDLKKVGLDRLADAAWAAEKYPLPVVTVDIGTATTFNVIDSNKVFRGGAIAPGVATGIQALAGRTSQLEAVKVRNPKGVIGKNTEECMLIGMVTGTAAMIDGLTARFEVEIGEKASLVLTGGLSEWIAPLCSHLLIRDPLMLSKGLALIYDRNQRF